MCRVFISQRLDSGSFWIVPSTPMVHPLASIVAFSTSKKNDITSDKNNELMKIIILRVNNFKL